MPSFYTGSRTRSSDVSVSGQRWPIDARAEQHKESVPVDQKVDRSHTGRLALGAGRHWPSIQFRSTEISVRDRRRWQDRREVPPGGANTQEPDARRRPRGDASSRITADPLHRHESSGRAPHEAKHDRPERNASKPPRSYNSCRNILVGLQRAQSHQTKPIRKSSPK